MLPPMRGDQLLRQSFGATLRELREKRGVSQEALALDSDLDRTFVSMLERGLRQPSLNSLFSIAASLDIAPSQIVRLTERELGRRRKS